MTTAIFLKNIAFTFFWTSGDYILLFMAGALLITIFAVLFDYLTRY
jgi:hypothetical protein